MEPSDKPTEKQLDMLYQEYSSSVYGAMLNAKERGATRAEDAIKDLLDTTTIRKAVELIPTKHEASIAIKKRLQSPKNIHVKVQQVIDRFLAPYEVDIKVFYDE